MNELRHPFIVELISTFKDSMRLFMAMEFVIGGELWSILANGRAARHLSSPSQLSPVNKTPHGLHPFFRRPLDLSFVRFIIGSLALVLEHVHNREFVYRDLKPENLMIGADGYVKLIDFGFCKQV